MSCDDQLGRIAYIDLSERKVAVSPISKEVRHFFVGGRGINMYLLYNYVEEDIDALDPNNVLIFGAGLLTGVRGVPSASRFNVSAKSPITGFLGDSNCGGFWGPELRFAGFDHLLIRGRASNPIYLWITDDQIEFRDASRLWGLDTIETQQVLKEELGSRVQVVCIGQAGENLVRFSCIRHGSDAAGRTGMGAVMGSKNLKAIAVRGTKKVEVKYPGRLREIRRAILNRMKERKVYKFLSSYGTSYLLDAHQKLGNLCVKNNQRNTIEEDKWESLSCENLRRHTSEMRGCFGCSIRCKHICQVPYGPNEGSEMEGPEYFSIAHLGAGTGTYDLETVLVANDLCNRYGMDVASCGSIIAWAMELYQRGIIDEKLTDGLNLTWGNKEVLIKLIDKIALREGFGNLLAEDGIRASQIIGQDSKDYFIHVKGLSGETEERGLKGCALNIATASRGADHLRSRPIPEGMFLPADFLESLYKGPVSPDPQSYDGKGRMVTATEKWMTIPDLLGICKFLTKGFLSPHMLGYDEYADLVNSVMGMNLTATDVEKCAERVITLERMFNLREGLQRKHDTLPMRFFEEKSTKFGILGGNKIDRDKFDQMLDEYYDLHGWDRNGIPTEETIQKLGLDKLSMD